MRALVLDDSRATRAILRRFLEELDFEVHEAGDGRAGADTLTAIGAVDLALVDWNMPAVDGLEFVQSVRAVERYASMRIVMVTTESEIANVVRALEAGADEYVMKPFTSAVLREKLELLGMAVDA